MVERQDNGAEVLNMTATGLGHAVAVKVRFLHACESSDVMWWQEDGASVYLTRDMAAAVDRWNKA